MSMSAIKIDGYEIDILVQGFPGKQVCHGGLGWSTVALIRGRDRVALVDVGSFNMRRGIIEGLASRGLQPDDVTDVLLTHSHYDHSVNWTLFPDARIVIGTQELEWALTVPWGRTPVPELYVRELQRWPTAHTAVDGEELLPGVRAYVAPGHTPGHLIFVLTGRDRDVVFTGDAAKNRAEMLSRRADASYDATISTATIETIWALWRRRPGSVLVPGHVLPMSQQDGRTEYLGKRDVVVKAWFGDDLETTTFFALQA
jgi:N-acyl homoserine lactone hydrolase